MCKLREPYDLAKEIWTCIVDCQLDGNDAIEYIAGILTDDRELITRKILNGNPDTPLH